MRRFARILLPVALALTVSACGVNTVPTKEEAAKAAWADVENQYQRRADLVPNLVASVKGAAAQERGTLEAVTKARAEANRVTLSPDQLSDPAAMERFAQAQAGLSASLIPLRQLQEAYPDLKTNENFLQLQQQLEGTENRIAVARRDYNGAVQDYNTTIRTFPSLVAAKFIYGAEPLQPFKATTEGAEEAPTVAF
jgi:LemA protein